MRTGQCVEPKFSTAEPRLRGHVTRVDGHGGFRVSYDSHWDDKGHKIVGGRFWYPASSAAHFTVIA